MQHIWPTVLTAVVGSIATWITGRLLTQIHRWLKNLSGPQPLAQASNAKTEYWAIGRAFAMGLVFGIAIGPLLYAMLGLNPSKANEGLLAADVGVALLKEKYETAQQAWKVAEAKANEADRQLRDVQQAYAVAQRERDQHAAELKKSQNAISTAIAGKREAEIEKQRAQAALTEAQDRFDAAKAKIIDLSEELACVQQNSEVNRGGASLALFTPKQPCKPLSTEEASILALSPGKSFRECANCPEMVVVPAGNFQMGSQETREGPQHTVVISKAFAAGKFPVTRAEFAAFVRDTSYRLDNGCGGWKDVDWKQDSSTSWRSPGFVQTDSDPAVCVNWDDAKAYTAWISRKTGAEYRLLSEAEREYLARAGTTTAFWWGDTITKDQANFNTGLQAAASEHTAPVTKFAPNMWGFYQIHGNVWEWVEDCWNSNYNGAPLNGSAWTTGKCGSRLLRGGSWHSPAKQLRASYRFVQVQGVRSSNVGFRCARALYRETTSTTP